ncbi:MAG: GDP-mannose 4,6-dehydratase [Nitrospirae bacterium]|nr:GDP-mannose 4,6-dehydratase [Nitrospirota bacterium]MDA1303683.1 GDP-mannose 4,6-dehydratase [Nitrospirota bacterium]
MNVLVTGGAGFIGSHVVDRFVQEGHQVSVIDNLVTGKRKNVNREAVLYKHDICSSRLDRIFKREHPVVIVHLAAQMNVRRSTEDPMFDANVNILGTINLLQLAVKYGVRKVVFASSGGAVYGEQHQFPASENHPTAPLSPYGISKLSCEFYLDYFRQMAGLGFTALRFGNVYGPRQNPEGEAGVIAIFTQQLLKGQQSLINGNGLQTRDYVYVRDVVEAVMIASDQQVNGIYNVGTGEETTVNDIFEQLKALTKVENKELHGPVKKGEQLRSVLNCSKLTEETGWEPTVTLAEGLAETVAFFQEKK